MTTSSSVSSSSSRNFLLRLPDSERHSSLVAYLEGLTNINYHISSLDAAGAVHVFCQFAKPSRLCASKLCGAVIERPFASPQRNIEYVRSQAADGRTDNVAEWGSVRTAGPFGAMQTIGDLKDMAMADVDGLPWTMYRTVSDIKARQGLRVSYKELSKDVKVYYVWGRSGVGKTSLAKKIFEENAGTYGEYINRVSYNNGFWEGVDGETAVALYDDFRDYHMRESEFVRFVDYNVQNMNVKGGMRPNVFRLIVITSIQSPDDIYPNMSPETRVQWTRRMEIVHLT